MSSGFDLMALLPAGEWADIRLMDEPMGMMNAHAWAVLAEATSVRFGGIPAFLKVFLPAATDAGSQTQRTVGKERLGRLAARLEGIRERQRELPIVRILDVRRLSDDSLLVAMERVKILKDLIADRTAGRQLAARVIRDLDCGTGEQHRGWHHFDISPNNIGVNSEGAPIFIDVESFYFTVAEKVEITLPAWRFVRAPSGLRNDVHESLDENSMQLPESLAVLKHTYELVLASAECALGTIPDVGHTTLEAWFGRWPVGSTTMTLARQYQDALRLLERKIVPTLMPLLAELDRQEVPETADGQAPVVPADPGGSTEDIDAQKRWRGLHITREALRGGRLNRSQRKEYRAILAEFVLDFPKWKEAWDELLLVALAYDRDVGAADAICEKAEIALAGDEEFKRWRRLIAVGVKGKA